MCGIHFGYNAGRKSSDAKFFIPGKFAEKNKSRGPDQKKVVEGDNYIATFYRLAIMGVDTGVQPFDYDDMLLMCNGEIYNYKELIDLYNLDCNTDSDCECIMWLYRKIGLRNMIDKLDGEFAFILYDKRNGMIYFARDILGRKPLYFSQFENILEISSLYGGLECIGEQVQPRNIYSYDTNTKTIIKQEYNAIKYLKTRISDTEYIYEALEKAVLKRIQHSERPIGFLLSGGFDSSLVLSIAMKYYDTLYQNHVNNLCPNGGHFRDIVAAHEMAKEKRIKPHVFTFGFDINAPDVKSATIMIEWLKKKYGYDSFIWHLVIEPVQKGLDSLEDVIVALETYDTTTIRAGTPMYLISKYIKEYTDVRVIISGEGSDELFGGYLYFMYAESDSAFKSEIIKLLNELYLFDVLRCDRTTAVHGLEVRPPFLDDHLVWTVLDHQKLKKCNVKSKELIRLTVQDKNLLPVEILEGKKEAFSDAVGYSWKDSIESYAINKLKEMTTAESKHYDSYSPHIKPITNEMMYYQKIFSNNFGEAWHLLPHLWLPNQNWVKTGSEPSARVLSVYKN